MADENKVAVSPLNGQPVPKGRRYDSQTAREAARKSVESRRRKKATRQLTRQILAQRVPITTDVRSTLASMGYDTEAEGTPTLEEMALLQIARQAVAGDLDSLRLLYDYAQIEDLRATLERERIKARTEASADAAKSDRVTVVIDV